MATKTTPYRVPEPTCKYITLFLLICCSIILVLPGLHEYFSPDDTTNLFKSWIKSPQAVSTDSIFFWQGATRPLGQLAYRLLYWAFGWKPLPFRLSCLALLEANLFLTFFYVRKLSKSGTFRVLAPVIAAFHGALWNIYANTGCIYDILCLFFTLIGLLYYATRRVQSRAFRLWDSLVISVIAIAAFESKEIGFMLPAVLLAYELIFYFPDRRADWSRWPLWTIVPSAVCCCLGAIGIRYSSDVFFTQGGYTPAFTAHRYLETLATYFYFLFFKTISFSNAGAVFILIASFAAALILKSRVAVFGWAMFFLTLLPLSFAPPRADGYVLYIPWVGCAIFLAAVADASLTAAVGTNLRWAATAVLCALVVWVQFQQRATTAEKGFGPGGMSWIEQLTVYASTMCPSWGPSARVAVINNPFADRWQADFVLNLTCKRKDIQVDTFKQPEFLGRGTAYTTVALYEGDHYRNLGPSEAH